MFRFIFTVSFGLSLSLATPFASAGITDTCGVLKPELSVKAGLLLRKYRTQNKKPDSKRALLIMTPGSSPEITAVNLPEKSATEGTHISKTTLDAIKKASGGGKQVIIWNEYGHSVDLLPYENAEQMSASFSPGKDCSPHSQTVRRLCASCCVVDFTKFTSGATALYGESAERCELIKKYALRSFLSKEEEDAYIQAKKTLAAEFNAKTGEKRELAIDKESTIVLPKKVPGLEIGDQKPNSGSKVPAEVDDAL